MQQIVKRVVKILLITAAITGLLLHALTPGSDGLAAGTGCTGENFRQSERLVRAALKARVIMPAKGEATLTVQVSPAWWAAHADHERKGLVAAINCAVAGEGKTLARLRLTDMENGAILYDGRP